MKKNVIKRVMAAGLSVAMLAAMPLSAFAATTEGVTYKVPTAPMTVDKTLITIAAHAQADVTPEILGLTNTTDRSGEVPNDYSLTHASSSALIGTFGTDINSAPNPYLYNWAYNSYAQENGLAMVTDQATLGGVPGSPNSEDTTIVESLGTSRSLYYRADILLGMGNDQGESYRKLIAELPENKDLDSKNDYNPYIINYASSVCADFLYTLYDLANTCEEIIEKDNTRHLRYGDPIEVADSLTEYTVGIQSYVLEQLEKNNAQKKVVAVVDPNNSKDGIFYCVDENTSVQGTTSHSRAGEFVASTTENVVKKLGKTAETGKVGTANNKTYYILTAEEIVANSDAIIISGVQNADGDEAAFRELLQQYIDPSKKDLMQKAQTVPMMSKRFACCGSIGANSIENLLGMAYWTSFVYSEYLNPVYVATYWYQNFYHISDNSMLKTIIATNLASASKPEGVTTDISSYSKSGMESIIQEGMDYYNANKRSLKGTLIADYAAYLNHDGETDETGAEVFTDVPAGSWYYDAVDYAVKNELFYGTSDDKFSPAADMTREMFVTVLHRSQNKPSVITSSGFKDVAQGTWYTDAVSWAKSTEIVAGVSETQFGVGQSITREQLVTMLYRASKYLNKDVSATAAIDSFNDAAQVSSFAQDAMKWAVGSGLVVGNNNNLNPKATASRAEVAAIFQRYLTK